MNPALQTDLFGQLIVRPANTDTPLPAHDFHLDGLRGLASGWKQRGADNITAISLARRIHAEGRPATRDEQAKLIRFVGFGASELANGVFPATKVIKPGFEGIVASLRTVASHADLAALSRATQYAHYTPEWIVRALWDGMGRMGFAGGRVLEPGVGTGLFIATAPDGCRFTGVEACPVTARITSLLYPSAEILAEDFTTAALSEGYDAAIGNPPFSDRSVRAKGPQDGFSLHDFFLARSLSLVRPGGLAAFVVSRYTMDKGGNAARMRMAALADLVAAFRLPAGAMRADAGTDVVVDLLFFRRRAPDVMAAHAAPWMDLAGVPAEGSKGVSVNSYYAHHPAAVLGRHALASSQYGLAYTVLPDAATALPERLTAAIATVPLADAPPPAPLPAPELLSPDPVIARVQIGTAASGARFKEGSYFVSAADDVLAQIIGGKGRRVAVKDGRGTGGIFPAHARILRGLIPIREAIRDVLRAQEADEPWQEAQARLGTAYDAFVKAHGPINLTKISERVDADGTTHETFRRPNLSPFLDDPDCWLVASVESYDIASGLATRGPIFSTRVVMPPPVADICSTRDALAVVLNQQGRVDVAKIAEIMQQPEAQIIGDLGSAIYRDPETGDWLTDDHYLSGLVRTKLRSAATAATVDADYERNVLALREVQPIDIPPSEITARLGQPWIPVEAVEQFIEDIMGVRAKVFHSVEIGAWTVYRPPFANSAAATSDWGTSRRHAGILIEDALNSITASIYDEGKDLEGRTIRVLNVEATEAAKDKLNKIKAAFTEWVWTDTDRADRLSRLYNDEFNNLLPRHFDGSHLMLPGASNAVQLRPFQKRAIWRIVAAGCTYVAHIVGSGKTIALAAACMEQRRLGLVSKPMIVVPGHTLAQWSREFLMMYPNARILVADELNFAKDKRSSFIARAATGSWDAIIITHSAFKFIAVPAEFERALIEEQMDEFEAILQNVESDDRVTRKQIERSKEKLQERLKALRTRKDDMVTISEMGVDQIIVDEAQAFRKLTFPTSMTNLKGVDPDGSQMAWDLYVKGLLMETKNPGRGMIMASGTPITNTLAEMFTLQRYMGQDALTARGIHRFNAWASAFGDTRTDLELQPSGNYHLVTRFAEFVNVPELISMFRAFADVVQRDDLIGLVKVPRVTGGQRQLITAPASVEFKRYQRTLAERIKLIEERKGAPKKGDDILLSVITDGRHGAIDLRLVGIDVDEPENKLNLLIANVFRIWQETKANRYMHPGGATYALPGAAQMVFSDLGTEAMVEKRGFSAYVWIRERLIAMGVPASQIAFMQHFKKSDAKQRLFNDVNSGRCRILLGSSETMGTGVNAQQRLVALHHLDVPWLPSQIEQREGRIERQGNQNDEVGIYAYATLGSMDATMWQANERKSRFIASAMAGERGLRRLEDVGATQADQFGMAKAIASGDTRLMRKAGLESEVARFKRLRSAHFDDQLAVRRRVEFAEHEIATLRARIPASEQDASRVISTRGDLFVMTLEDQSVFDRVGAGTTMMAAAAKRAREGVGGQWQIGSMSGFPVLVEVEPARKLLDEAAASIILQFSAHRAVWSVGLGTSPTGLVAKLEHAVANIGSDLEATRALMVQAQARLEAYRGRVGKVFAFAEELEFKQQELDDLNADLADTEAA